MTDWANPLSLLCNPTSKEKRDAAQRGREACVRERAGPGQAHGAPRPGDRHTALRGDLRARREHRAVREHHHLQLLRVEPLLLGQQDVPGGGPGQFRRSGLLTRGAWVRHLAQVPSAAAGTRHAGEILFTDLEMVCRQQYGSEFWWKELVICTKGMCGALSWYARFLIFFYAHLHSRILRLLVVVVLEAWQTVGLLRRNSILAGFLVEWR